jgi:hypothetical protein
MAPNEMMKVQDNSPIPTLTRLQKEVGYEEGTLNLVALLGMFGEAGEVLAEVSFEMCPKGTAVDQAFMETIKAAIDVAAKIDAWKKSIREKEYTPQVIITVEPEFKKELADQMYYVNALALGQNSSLSELAVIVTNKVRTKMANKPIGHANT